MCLFMSLFAIHITSLVKGQKMVCPFLIGCVFLSLIFKSSLYILGVYPFSDTGFANVFSSVQYSRSAVSDSVNPWTTACQVSLPVTNSQSLFKLMSIKSVMPSNHLILCCPLLLLPLILPSIRVFSSKSVLHIRWPKYWNLSFSISLSNEY